MHPLTLRFALGLAGLQAALAASPNAQALQIEGGAIARPAPDATGVLAYKGLPYAAPPVGRLRWKPPQPAEAWTGVRPTDRFGPDCMQAQATRPDDPPRPRSEDCLYLNVWSAAQAGEARPVMVWIHGGGSVVGSGSQPQFDGAALARKGVVVVTLNYRLGLFGFLSTPALSAESGHAASGNYGFMDDIAALEWVQRNIRAFGGDPARVTIAGESSGSVTNSVLMISPLARGLFRGVIGESGSAFRAVEAGSMGAIGLAAEEDKGRALAEAVGAQDLDQLRATPAEALMGAAAKMPFFFNRPVVDGYLLPSAPWRMYAARRQNDVNLLVGWNSDEGSTQNASNFKGSLTQALTDHFGASADEVAPFYPAGPDGGAHAIVQLAGDDGLAYPTWLWAMGQATYGSKPVFVYQFRRAPPVPAGWFGARLASDKAGAFHGGEIVYVFDNLQAEPTWAFTDDDRRLADRMSSYWANFVKTGDPNGPGLPPWPRYRSTETPQRMELGAEVRAKPDPDFRRFQALWAAHRRKDPPEPVGP